MSESIPDNISTKQEGNQENTQEIAESYEKSARLLAERGAAILEEVTKEKAGSGVYRPVGSREDLDFIVKFYTKSYSFESHCVGASCKLFLVINQGQTLDLLEWRTKLNQGHSSDSVTESILRGIVEKIVERERKE